MRYLLTLVIVVAIAFFFWNRYEPQNGKTTAIENVSSGVVRYGDDTFDSLQGNGLVTLNGTTVKGPLVVNGSLKALKIRAGSLHCNGHAAIQQSTIAGKAEVNGFLNSIKSTFEGPLEVAAQKVDFSDCTLKSLKMQNATWVLGSQTVRLKGSTVVKGDITFETGEGKVFLSPNSRIEGKVINGTVEKIEATEQK